MGRLIARLWVLRQSGHGSGADDTPPSPILLARFVRATAVLALPAEGQERWLDSLGSVASWNVDELAHEFDFGFRLSRQWVAAGWLCPTVEASLAAVDAQLDAMSGPGRDDLWSREGLARDAEWAEVRRLAREALNAM